MEIKSIEELQKETMGQRVRRSFFETWNYDWRIEGVFWKGTVLLSMCWSIYSIVRFLWRLIL